MILCQFGSWSQESVEVDAFETCREDLDRAGIINDLILIHDSF